VPLQERASVIGRGANEMERRIVGIFGGPNGPPLPLLAVAVVDVEGVGSERVEPTSVREVEAEEVRDGEGPRPWPRLGTVGLDVVVVIGGRFSVVIAVGVGVDVAVVPPRTREESEEVKDELALALALEESVGVKLRRKSDLGSGLGASSGRRPNAFTGSCDRRLGLVLLLEDEDDGRKGRGLTVPGVLDRVWVGLGAWAGKG
jgi:hypothetical protein